MIIFNVDCSWKTSFAQHICFTMCWLLASPSISVVGLQFIRQVYWDFEYEEVVTPNIYNFELWKTSGHADHYKQNMFSFDIEKQEFGLKPMNCPGQPHHMSSTPSVYRFGASVQCNVLP